MKELMFENQCLNNTIQQMRKGEVNMFKEINPFPSFFLPSCFMACALATPPYYYPREWGGTHKRQKYFLSYQIAPN